jgi:hypothetical protein
MGRDGEGKVSSRVAWDHGGQDSITQKEGFQVSKRELAKGNQQGEHKGNAPQLRLLNLYNIHVYHIIILYEC